MDPSAGKFNGLKGGEKLRANLARAALTRFRARKTGKKIPILLK